MIRGGRILSVVVALGAIARGATGQSVEPTIRTNLDTAVIHVGDRVQLTVEVSHADSEGVVWPDLLALDPFEVLDAQIGEPAGNDDRVVSTLGLTLTAFDLGDFELPSFQVVVGGDTLTTDSWMVTVESVGLDEDGQIRDVKGPVSMARNWLLLWPWVVGVVVLVSLGVWAYRRYRDRERPAPQSPRAPTRAPHEIALEALAALERSGLLERGAYKEYCIRVSDVFRTYVEARFDVDAMEMVTDEVIAGLTARGVDRQTVETARTFLERCDLVKFAKHMPAPEASREIVPTVRTLVERTRPTPTTQEVRVA